MILPLLALVGLALNLSIAYLTAQDAHKRGHDRDKWFLISSVFGIFGIIVYLLVRNDREVPESERQPKRTKSRAAYIASAVFMGVILMFISAQFVSPLLVLMLGLVGLIAAPVAVYGWKSDKIKVGI